uniref:Uncharacterized protein n=1 Tax=Rhizophora mucronata TaxID=61149 RepID=A0A2P2J1Q8_RHIMU
MYADSETKPPYIQPNSLNHGYRAPLSVQCTFSFQNAEIGKSASQTIFRIQERLIFYIAPRGAKRT